MTTKAGNLPMTRLVTSASRILYGTGSNLGPVAPLSHEGLTCLYDCLLESGAWPVDMACCVGFPPNGGAADVRRVYAIVADGRLWGASGSTTTAQIEEITRRLAKLSLKGTVDIEWLYGADARKTVDGFTGPLSGRIASMVAEEQSRWQQQLLREQTSPSERGGRPRL